ncbi:hypothetical protein [Thermoleptolyngbya sp. M55_K2018_002]|uniref:hypothetical protein n=1 Tax=Thermoleptolyngbya sp. M55_K2018_002 TaxID=2747808 RepID=UPI0025E8FF2E|nr:hypothetical protein [Thermoleptolyngbya sp. M55_K2018_002]
MNGLKMNGLKRILRQIPLGGIASAALLVGLASCSGGADPTNTARAPEEAAAEGQPAASSDSSLTAAAASGQDLTVLFSRVWRMTQAPSEPALGSIYVFLANGTFLQTSCVETYALSGWTIDKDAPNVLRVSENGQVALTAEILELTNTTLRLRQTLVRSGDTQEVTLSALEDEFICPDLPR